MGLVNSKDILARFKDKTNTLSISDSGKGKTYFIGTLAEYGNPFLIDAECGAASAIDPNHKEFDIWEANTWDEFQNGCKYFLENREEKGYTHLVIDSITRLQQYLVDQITDGSGKPSQNQWGEILATLRKTIDWVTKKCPVHTHVTAMAMESKEETTGSIKIFPNIQGAFKHDLAGYFDVVLYHECGLDKEGNQRYWVQTKGDQRIIARSRLSRIKDLPKFCESNYKIIADIIGLTKLEDTNV